MQNSLSQSESVTEASISENGHKYSLNLSQLEIGYKSHCLFNNLSTPRIPQGSLVAVIGPNGVGKSSLLRSIAGLQPSKGEIQLGKTSLNKLPLNKRVNHIGYVPQMLPQSSPLTAYEVVFSAIKTAEPALTKTQINRAIEDTFTQLELIDLAFVPLTKLSGGQRQMIAVAQILARAPTLLLLDEPTSALDIRWQLKVINALKDQIKYRNAIGLMAIHDINLALRSCDYLLILKPNHTTTFGATHDVMTPKLLKDVYGIEGRIERCSQGHPQIIADRAI